MTGGRPGRRVATTGEARRRIQGTYLGCYCRMVSRRGGRNRARWCGRGRVERRAEAGECAAGKAAGRPFLRSRPGSRKGVEVGSGPGAKRAAGAGVKGGATLERLPSGHALPLDIAEKGPSIKLVYEGSIIEKAGNARGNQVRSAE